MAISKTPRDTIYKEKNKYTAKIIYMYVSFKYMLSMADVK